MDVRWRAQLVIMFVVTTCATPSVGLDVKRFRGAGFVHKGEV